MITLAVVALLAVAGIGLLFCARFILLRGPDDPALAMCAAVIGFLGVVCLISAVIAPFS